MITVSVPGKIHLMGEHAVVYGKPAVLAAVDIRMTVSIQPSITKGLHIYTNEDPTYATYAVEKVCEQLKYSTVPSVDITIHSQIPAGFHLGSSAATAVGVVAATVYFLKKLWNPTSINALAYEVEKKQHGNPSGGDNTSVTYGGFVWYRKELEFLKSMWQLPVSVSKKLDHFYLIETGRPVETTGEMVAYIRSQVAKYPTRYKKIFDENETQTKKIAIALREQNEKNLVDAIQRGEKTLEDMGVVSKKITSVIRDIEHRGVSAKILGGGGRKEGVGCLLCYDPTGKNIEVVSKKYQYQMRKISLGGEGVKLERKE